MSELDSEVTPTVQTLSMVKKHKIGLFLHDGTKRGQGPFQEGMSKSSMVRSST